VAVIGWSASDLQHQSRQRIYIQNEP
jgi:hypothetical protein